MAQASAQDQVVAAVDQVVRAIPGVLVLGIVAEERPGGGWDVATRVSAWSPSLHAVPATWNIQLGRYAPTGIPLLGALRRNRLVDEVRHRLERHVTLQFARADRARGLGIEDPLHLPNAATAASSRGSIVIDHLVVERHGLLKLVDAISVSRGTAGADRVSLDQQLSFDAASAHEAELQGPTVHAADSVRDDAVMVRGVNVIRKLPVMMREMHIEEGTESLLQPTFAIGSGSTAATFNGSHLIVLAPVPETLLVASVGLRVGEVIATGTGVDERTILSAQRIGAATVLEVAVDAVRLSDLPHGEVTRAAVEAMPCVS